MIVKATLNEKQEPAAEQIAQVEKAAELPPAMEKAFRLAAQSRNRIKKANA